MAEERQGPVIYRAIFLAAGLLVLGLVFRHLVTLALAVLMTVIIAIFLAAVATRLERLGVPRPLGAIAGLFGAFAVVAAVLAFVIPPFVDETRQFVKDVPGIVRDLQEKVGSATGTKPGEVGDKTKAFLQRYVDKPERLVDPIASIGLGFLGVLAALVVMIITALYMAIRPEPLISGLLSLIPPDRRDQARFVMSRLRTAWIGWLRGVVIHMLLTLVFIYFGLTLVGLDFAVVFAVISALLVVIPYFGAIFSSIPPILFALTDSPGKAALVALVYVIAHQLEGNVIIPLVMSRQVKIHPAVIAVGVVVVGELFGFVGLVVAVPILSAIVILTHELWVKPMEARHTARRAGGPGVMEEEIRADAGIAPTEAGNGAEQAAPGRS